MKKKLLLAMFTIATVFSLVACSGSESTSSKKEDTKKEDSKKDDDEDKKKPSADDKDISDLFDALTGKDDDEPTPTEAPSSEERGDGPTKPEITEEPVVTEAPVAPTETPSIGDDLPGTNITTDVGFTESTIIDNEQFSFKILGVEMNNTDKLAVKVQMENKTDFTLCFDWEDVYLNSALCDPYWSTIIYAGETEEETITFRYCDEFDLLNLDELTSIHFTLIASDFDDWLSDSLFEEDFVFYPNGKENATVFNYTPGENAFVATNDNGITFTVADYYYNDNNDFIVLTYIENNTDKSIIYSWDEVSLNDIMLDPYFAKILAPGMRTLAEVYFDVDELALCEITDVTKIDFLLIACEEDDWISGTIMQDTFVLYPKGVDAAMTQTRAPKDTDVILFNTPETTMVVTECVSDDFDYNVNVYIENNTDSTLYYQCDTSYVNGIELDPFFIISIAPGKKCYDSFTWSNYDLEDAGITEITSIELPIVVENLDVWPSEEYVNDTFTITP